MRNADVAREHRGGQAAPERQGRVPSLFGLQGTAGNSAVAALIGGLGLGTVALQRVKVNVGGREFDTLSARDRRALNGLIGTMDREQATALLEILEAAPNADGRDRVEAALRDRLVEIAIEERRAARAEGRREREGTGAATAPLTESAQVSADPAAPRPTQERAALDAARNGHEGADSHDLRAEKARLAEARKRFVGDARQLLGPLYADVTTGKGEQTDQLLLFVFSNALDRVRANIESAIRVVREAAFSLNRSGPAERTGGHGFTMAVKHLIGGEPRGRATRGYVEISIDVGEETWAGLMEETKSLTSWMSKLERLEREAELVAPIIAHEFTHLMLERDFDNGSLPFQFGGEAPEDVVGAVSELTSYEPPEAKVYRGRLRLEALTVPDRMRQIENVLRETNVHNYFLYDELRAGWDLLQAQDPAGIERKRERAIEALLAYSFRGHSIIAAKRSLLAYADGDRNKEIASHLMEVVYLEGAETLKKRGLIRCDNLINRITSERVQSSDS
ncbi:hypothetical protein ACGGZK_11680 [Agromyces sp. MMS24-K17]|uniref:hypothetical protein n=1 Tax=Agromyces sp. MMS24-K17 TaxID=3372850 RepID=UPI0037542174